MLIVDRPLLDEAVAAGTSGVVRHGRTYHWNQLFTGQITSTKNLFRYNNLIDDGTNSRLNITGWDTSNVPDMYGMFELATRFNQPIGKWNTSNVFDMSHMCYNAPNFNQNIGSWDTSGVAYMVGTFWRARSFNQPIGSWNTSKVVSMNGMFRNATNFNQNLTKWCVSNIENAPDAFSIGPQLADSNQPQWGTCRESSRL